MTADFDVIKGYHAAAIFVYSLWKDNVAKLPEKDHEALGDLGSDLWGDIASLDEWRLSYLHHIGEIEEKDLISDDISYNYSIERDPISAADGLDVLRIHSLMHFKNYGFEFPEFIKLLESMLKNPEQHPNEWALWEDAIKRAMAGETPGW